MFYYPFEKLWVLGRLTSKNEEKVRSRRKNLDEKWQEWGETRVPTSQFPSKEHFARMLSAPPMKDKSALLSFHLFSTFVFILGSEMGIKRKAEMWLPSLLTLALSTF